MLSSQSDVLLTYFPFTGSEIHTLALAEPVKAEEGDHVVFTVRTQQVPTLNLVHVLWYCSMRNQDRTWCLR